MTERFTPPKVHSSIASLSAGPYSSALALLLLSVLVFLSIYLQRPPHPSPVTAPAVEFSSARAMLHIEAIAQRPHPMGSPEHSRVRDYILEQLVGLGLDPQVQKTTAVTRHSGTFFNAGTVENIVARLQGANPGKAVMLVGHYDSVPTGPGASDDGNAVAVMLEALRALKAEPPLLRDVIFLFTDGEEAELLGAQAFVSEHPWAYDVGLVLNFEARGVTGPAIMFETSDNNGWLISEFAKAAPRPFANSLSYEIYKLLPTDTDMTIFKQAGLSGLNFAYIGGFRDYHSQFDNIGRIDERSLQHQGSYALALARHFGNLAPDDPKRANAVYFDIFGLTLIHYSSAWIFPLALSVIVLFVGLAVRGLRRGHLTVRGIASGSLVFLLIIITVTVTLTIVRKIIFSFESEAVLGPQSEASNSIIYLISLVLLGIAITSVLYTWFGTKIGLRSLTFGALLWWLILLVVTSWLLPGGSYIFMWPLFFSLLGAHLMFPPEDAASVSPKRLAMNCLFSIPAIILFAPMIYNLFTALTLDTSELIWVMVVLLLGICVPHLATASGPNRWLLPGVFAALSLVMIIAGSFASGFDNDYPRPNSITYGLDADKGSAVWASSDGTVDEWTSQFFSSTVERVLLTEYLPFSSMQFLKGQAPSTTMEGPRVELLESKVDDSIRSLHMHISSPRQAPIVSFYLDPGKEVLRSFVNGKAIEYAGTDEKGWGFRYFAFPKEGIDIALATKSDQPVRIRVVEQHYGLPEIPGLAFRERPENMMPALSPYTDSTFVARSFSF
jgi:hypothetical protein